MNENGLLLFGHTDFTRRDKITAIRAFSRVHMALITYSVISSLVLFLVQFILIGIYGDDEAIAILSTPIAVWSLQVLACYIIAFPVFLRSVRDIASSIREKSRIGFKEFVMLFFAGQGIAIIGTQISNLVTKFFSNLLNHEIPDSTSDTIMETPILVMVLVVCIIGPIVEEIMFRKIMIDKLSVYGDRLAVIVSSLAFGLFHGNFHQLFYAAGLGLLLGYVYTKTRRSIYNIILHCLFNLFGTLPTYLSAKIGETIPNYSIETGSLENVDTVLYSSELLMINLISVAQIAIYAIGLIVLVYCIIKKKIRLSRECDISIPLLKRPRVIFFNLGTLLFVCFMLLECILSLFLIG